MTPAREIDFAMLRVGMVDEMSWTVDNALVDAFAALSGDHNPLHVDAAYARANGFPDRISHGFLLGAKVSAFIGMLTPGRRCLLLEESLAFPNPVFPGDTITLRGEVVELWPEQAMMRLKVKATKTAVTGKLVVVGRGSILCLLS